MSSFYYTRVHEYICIGQGGAIIRHKDKYSSEDKYYPKDKDYIE